MEHQWSAVDMRGLLVSSRSNIHRIWVFIANKGAQCEILKTSTDMRTAVNNLNYLIHKDWCWVDKGEGKKFYVFLGIAILGVTYPLLDIFEVP